jgi:4-diphosphocytidyl-2C-methyl-D-erythritol kinase
LTEAGLEGVCLSGSGSTLFGFLPQEGCAEQVEKSLQGTGTLKWTRLREERRGD